MSEKPVMIILPSWNPDDPRFVVEECPRCSDDRVYKNDKCVYNQRLGFAYSVDELVEVLNNTESEDKLNVLNDLIDDKLSIGEPLVIPFHKLEYGEDKGYWRGYVEALKEVRKVIADD